MNAAGIVCNSNSVPFDKRSPFDPSGIRMGTAAVTTRGFGPDEMKKIAGWISKIAADFENESLLSSIRSEVDELCASYPVPELFVNLD
jgi:glycine hydroxymethyltransferase